jgi:IS30 family transposase
MPASTVTMPEARHVAKLYGMGYSQTQIARSLGRSRSAIRTALRLLGIPTRTPTAGYRAWLARRGGKGPHDGGAGAFGRRRAALPSEEAAQ